MKTGFCALCRSRCGARFEVMGDVLVAAHPEPNHPTGAALCTKGRAAPEIRANPNRILYPMRRTTPKGSSNPGWQRISWDEALDEVAHRLGYLRERVGAETVAFAVTTGSGTPISDSNEWIDRFIRVFGSPNIVMGTEICNWHKDNMHQLTNGTGIAYPDYVNTDLIFLWGFNPSATWLDQATQIAAARARGAKIISVDPRSAGFAGSATQWLKICPGRDGVLALGLIRATIAAGGYDENFLRRWTSACLLICEDTQCFLRGSDLGFDEKANHYIAWDGSIVFYDAVSRCFDANSDNLHLNGRIKVKGGRGMFSCRPAFDLLTKAVDAYTPQRVEEETKIPLRDFMAAAELFIAAKTVAYYCWSGIGQHVDAAQTDRAIALLMALKGCQDSPGGNVVFTKVPSNPVGGHALSCKEQLAKSIGLKERPCGPATIGWVRGPDIATAILDHKPYPVRALMSFGSNFSLSQSDGNRTVEALKKLEFYVHCDSIVSSTAQFADIFLPVNTPWEREGLRIGFEISQEAESLVQLRQPVVPPAGQSRSDAEIVFALAMRLERFSKTASYFLDKKRGKKQRVETRAPSTVKTTPSFAEAFFYGDFDRARDWQLAPSGLNLAMLRARPEGIKVPQIQRYRKYAEATEKGYRGFATETGLIEIYSERLYRIGQSPLPVFAKAKSDSDFPLIMTTFKSPYFCHSQYRDIASLRRRHKVPRVIAHPELAEKLDLPEGEIVNLSTKNGTIQVELALDKNLLSNVVIADYGWGAANNDLGLPSYDPFSDKGANYNRLISAKASDPISGSVAHRGIACALHAPKERAKNWHGFREAKLVSTESVAEDCLRLGFAFAQDNVLPDYQPGQHIVLSLTDSSDGTEIIRCYSLVGAATDPQRKAYFITVRRRTAPLEQPKWLPGRMSNLLHNLSKADSKVKIMAPKGRFILPIEGSEPIIMIAGGIGITPFLCYLETMAALNKSRRLHLVIIHRNGVTHAYADRINELLGKISGSSKLIFYTRPRPSERLGVDYDRVGRFNADDLLPLDIDRGKALFFHCGPAAMMKSVNSMLHQEGIKSTHIFSEAFGADSLSMQADNLPQGPFNITFARSGQKMEWCAATGSVLALAEKAGIVLNSGCRAGQCETCAVNIIKGRVHHPETGDETSEFCLTCCAIPMSDLILDA